MSGSVYAWCHCTRWVIAAKSLGTRCRSCHRPIRRELVRGINGIAAVVEAESGPGVDKTPGPRQRPMTSRSAVTIPDPKPSGQESLFR